MDTHNNTLQSTTDKIVIAQFDNLNNGSYDIYYDYSDTNYAQDLDTGELAEGSYCPLPPYCLIEDKHRYIAS